MATQEHTVSGPVPRSDLPNPLDQPQRFRDKMGDRSPVLFSDYDGVLSPIMPTPDEAVMSGSMRQAVQRAAAATTLAVVSGRDLADVRSKVDLPGIYYAGSHGFDILGLDGAPAGGDLIERFEEYLDPLAKASDLIEHRLAIISGSMVERKRFATAIHYRNVARADVPTIETAVRDVAASYPKLVVTTGKEIFEYRPDLDWDKGKALEWLLEEIGVEMDRHIPIYLGDDTTDEDAFRSIRSRGIGVVVGVDGPATLATFSLADTAQVEQFLIQLAGEAGS